MDRYTLQTLARLRIKEARILLQAGCYEGAYHLAGYAVECGLKACIAKRTRRYEFPDRKVVQESYTHDLSKLVRVAGLSNALEQEIRRSPVFEANWAVVKEWNVDSRYRRPTRREAEDLYSAIVSRRDGVMRWIRQHW